jgi:hypothetical protein
MTETDAVLRARLDEAVPPFAAASDDWADVLRRAEARRLGRASPRVGVAVAALVGAVALLATPALGLGDRLRALVGADAADAVEIFRAHLTSPDRARTGTFAVRVHSLDARRPGSGRLRLFKGPLRWTLMYSGFGDAPRAAHVHLGDRRYTLCAPCSRARASGTLTRSAVRLLQSDRAIVDVHTERGANAAMRGQVNSLLRRPR